MFTTMKPRQQNNRKAASGATQHTRKNHLLHKKNMCLKRKNISEVDNNRDQPISSLLLDQKTNYYHHYFV